MKGFGIYVKNNLLEPKHYQSMGEAVWLYLWLLDKMTSVNENGIGKVLGNAPVSHDLVAADLGIHRNTYVKYVRRLREAGYINTLRTPYGLTITINKAEKIFKKSSTRTSATKKLSDAPKHVQPANRDAHETTHKMHTKRASDAHERVHAIKTIQDNTVDNTNTTDVVDPTGLGPRPNYGKPEINQLFTYWSETVGFDIESKVTANRRAASNLLKKYGAEKLQRLIEGVGMAQSDQYAPGIADFCDLQSKTTQLIAWGRKKHGNSSVTVIS